MPSWTRASSACWTCSTCTGDRSHELRTPMTGILGMAELLKGTPITLEQKTYVTAIGAAGRTLLDLIDELLDLSKIEAGRLSSAKVGNASGSRESCRSACSR